jgi:hypothetical protein
VATAAFLSALAACGGAAEPAKSPSAAPSQGGEAAPADVSQPSTAPQSIESAPPSQPSTGGAASSSSREIEWRNARGDLQSAQRELDASMGDCSNACRALTSLERATAHLCELASTSSDRGACDDAKTRVIRARAQIKASCGTCSNGASLDTGAPVPSR